MFWHCPHKRITWPQGKKNVTVFCFDCMRTLEYSWEEMKTGAVTQRVEDSDGKRPAELPAISA
jgi:hypothetical protein